jgi:hypothetical protein
MHLVPPPHPANFLHFYTICHETEINCCSFKLANFLQHFATRLREHLSVLNQISCYSTHFTMRLREHLSVLNQISCYSTHFTMRLREHLSVLNQISCYSTHFTMRLREHLAVLNQISCPPPPKICPSCTLGTNGT